MSTAAKTRLLCALLPLLLGSCGFLNGYCQDAQVPLCPWRSGDSSGVVSREAHSVPAGGRAGGSLRGLGPLLQQPDLMGIATP